MAKRKTKRKAKRSTAKTGKAASTTESPSSSEGESAVATKQDKPSTRKSKTRRARKPKQAAPKSPPKDELILVAVRGMILFPGVVFPIVIGRDRSIRAVQKAVQDELPLGMVLQRDPDIQDPTPEDLHEVGTQAVILRYLTAPDGSHHAITQGQRRFRIVRILETEPFLRAKVEFIEETEEEPSPELLARFHNLRTLATEALSLLPERNEELEATVENAGTPGQLCDLLATFMEISVEEKQAVLEMFDVETRVRHVFAELQKAAEVMRLSKKINQETRGALDKAQREYYLREQLNQIQKELGEGGSAEIAELAQKIESAGMTEEVKAEAQKELARLERTPEASMEHGIIRTYLDWMIGLPWAVSTDDNIDLDRAQGILDKDHFGLERVKRRIIEFLAVRKLKPDGKSPILCLVGPPGVGKTSLGHSVARAMGRKFVRISLGGVHDEAEIRGHRRTYVGAMPGRIIEGIRQAGSNNPVFLLDEMDKLGNGFHGDPSAALLEVLDPEQNKTFNDHYLGVPFDLSTTMFLATANVLHQIPGPLRDRCEVIELPGYTEEEKLEIARRFLVKRRLEANGLKASQCSISRNALRAIVRDYTREAGCRNLEREIGAVIRHVATLVARKPRTKRKIEPADLAAILGPVRYESEVAARTGISGVVTGLSWTPFGGQILFIEATHMPGSGRLVLTGQLGDVMRESAQAAFSLVKANAQRLKIDPEIFKKRDLHVHVPAGAIPKDGPSAGVTMYTALVSLFTDRKVQPAVAMTGEISLRGLVLPVGGIKDKVLAAYAAGIKTVLLPKRNMGDLEEVPESARKKLRFVPLEHVDQALEVALATTTSGRTSQKKVSPKPRTSKKASSRRTKSSSKKSPSRRKAPGKGRLAAKSSSPRRKRLADG